MSTTSENRRIVNIINFVRGIEPRIPELNLYEPVENQLRLLRQYNLPGTFLLQYDALLDQRYVDLLRPAMQVGIEVGVWLEVVEPLVKAAGLTWRGRYSWDWEAHVDFTIGYTLSERERLIDAYMATFYNMFGQYPSSIGAWIFDSHTLAYASEHYGIVAACNMKDQVGTDGYTLWGAYYSQAYYPSRLNLTMPAQNATHQVSVPVFRMLGSDPIYQYDSGLGKEEQNVMSLEPVYKHCGGSPAWVDWFFQTNFKQPSLGFSYAQVGQENSFGWGRMAAGLTYQIELVADWAAKGDVSVETLADCGRWYRRTFPVTPSTAVVALDDWQGNDRGAIWYDSRFYRAGLVWEGANMRIRDIHIFREDVVDPYTDKPCTTPTCHYETLPVLDGFCWSKPGLMAGITPMIIVDGEVVPCLGQKPTVQEAGEALRIHWPLQDGDELTILCAPESMTLARSNNAVTPDSADWFLQMSWTADAQVPALEVSQTALKYHFAGYAYEMCLDVGWCEQVEPACIRLHPVDGQIVMKLA